MEMEMTVICISSLAKLPLHRNHFTQNVNPALQLDERLWVGSHSGPLKYKKNKFVRT